MHCFHRFTNWRPYLCSADLVRPGHVVLQIHLLTQVHAGRAHLAGENNIGNGTHSTLFTLPNRQSICVRKNEQLLRTEVCARQPLKSSEHNRTVIDRQAGWVWGAGILHDSWQARRGTITNHQSPITNHQSHASGETEGCCTWKTSRFCLRSGSGNSILRSNRPGLSSAGSRVSARLVAMMTFTFTVWSNPSICSHTKLHSTSEKPCLPHLPLDSATKWLCPMAWGAHRSVHMMTESDQYCPQHRSLYNHLSEHASCNTRVCMYVHIHLRSLLLT